MLPHFARFHLRLFNSEGSVRRKLFELEIFFNAGAAWWFWTTTLLPLHYVDPCFEIFKDRELLTDILNLVGITTVLTNDLVSIQEDEKDQISNVFAKIIASLNQKQGLDRYDIATQVLCTGIIP